MTGPRLSVIPAGALADVASGSLKAMDLRVLCALGTFTNESGWAKVRQVTLARTAGTVREEVSRSMTRLVEHGWVEKHPGKHRAASSSYRVVLDPKCAPPDESSEVIETGEGDVSRNSHRDVSAALTRDVSAALTPMNDSSNDSPQSPPAGATAGQPASPANSGRAGLADPKPTRRKRRRRGQPEPEAVPVPELTVADLAIPEGAEGSVVRAALNGWQKPVSVRPWIGRFRVVDAGDAALGEGEVWKLAVDGDEDEFRRVFTGAAIHLGLIAQGERLPTWSMVFADRVVGKGRARWANRDPWRVEIKPEIAGQQKDTAA